MGSSTANIKYHTFPINWEASTASKKAPRGPLATAAGLLKAGDLVDGDAVDAANQARSRDRAREARWAAALPEQNS